MPLCPRKENSRWRTVYFLRKEQPSVSLALPPVGWQRTVVQPWQITTVWAWEKTVVMVKQPGHLTSMKNERGAGTSICALSALSKDDDSIHPLRTLSLCLRASAAGLGLRRSTARTWSMKPSASHYTRSLFVLPVYVRFPSQLFPSLDTVWPAASAPMSRPKFVVSPAPVLVTSTWPIERAGSRIIEGISVSYHLD